MKRIIISAVVCTLLAFNGSASAEDIASKCVAFGHDSATLGLSGAALIAQQAELLRGNPKLTIVLRNHADNTGSTTYGLAISAKQIEAVRTALLAAGVSPRQIRVTLLIDSPNEAAACVESECQSRQSCVDMLPAP